MISGEEEKSSDYAPHGSVYGDTTSADGVATEILKYGDYEIGYKLLKIMNMIFEKGELPRVFKDTLIKPL